MRGCSDCQAVNAKKDLSHVGDQVRSCPFRRWVCRKFTCRVTAVPAIIAASIASIKILKTAFDICRRAKYWRIGVLATLRHKLRHGLHNLSRDDSKLECA